MSVMASEIIDQAYAIEGAPHDLDPLLDVVGNAGIVLIGEATHGTHEFYRVRADLTQRLIAERGFVTVAVEADWPDAYRVNRFVRGVGDDDVDAADALGGFRRFPQWMWRNADVLDFVGWLRDYNDAVSPPAPQVGFYGLDLYSLHASIEAVLSYLRQVDPEAARRAEQRYACFENIEDPANYGYAAELGLTPTCENDVVQQLVELRRVAARADGSGEEDRFFAEQNARLIKNAEPYYRTMVRSQVESWNVRDRHMAETLDVLREHTKGKIVVWAHNSHVGDARATTMGEHGELNIGQLARQRYGTDVRTIGLTTYAGTVTAATEWGGPAERKRVRPAVPESYEALFHATAIHAFALVLGDASALADRRLERAIGVIYRPETERRSHYFAAALTQQFDAVVHCDTTRAVEPMEPTGLWQRGELPETYPSAL